MAGVWFEEIRQLSKKDEHVTPEFGQLKTTDINMNSDRFQRKQQSIYDDFVTFSSTSNCYKDKMELVEYVTKAGEKIDAPALFVACLCEDGKISKDKVKLANQIYVDFAKQMKMKRKGSVGRNYQPSSHSVNLCSLMALMKERYDWTYTMKDFHFTGGLSMVMSRLFQV